MEDVGINMVDIGLPGAGPRAVAHCEALAREIAGRSWKIKPNSPPAPIATISARSLKS